MDLLRAMHKTVHDADGCWNPLAFNAAIAKLYAFTAYVQKSKRSKATQREAIHDAGQLMAR